MMDVRNNCRLCSSSTREVVNIGKSPAANNFHDKEGQKSTKYPLIVDFCDSCRCIQLRDCLDHEFLFSDYSYITPDVELLSEHYSKLIDYLNENSFISSSSRCLELGSNKGLFLKHLKSHVCMVLGIDPAKNVAKLANDSGIDTIPDFFTPILAKKLLSDQGTFNLIIARHMFAHNSDPKILLDGIRNILSKKGTILIENAYAISTFSQGEFDQIYHEHMFYYSAQNMNNLLKKYGFKLIDLLDSFIHGGTIVFLAGREEERNSNPNVEKYLQEEEKYFLGDRMFIECNQQANHVKERVLEELNEDKKKNKLIGAYGATAKSFTMFTHLGLDKDMIKYCIDTSPTKIGKFFPSFGIPVVSEEFFKLNPVDTLLVTAWNYKDHIIKKSESLFPKGTKLIFPLPRFEVHIV